MLVKMQPRFLWFLILAYVAVMLLANWFDVRLVRMGDLITDAGTLIFPITFLLSDLITEVYGYKNARLAIWCGFLFNLLFIFYGLLITHMPSPHFKTMNPLIDKLYSFNTRIILSSIVSYLCSEPINSFILSKLKILLKGRWMFFRFIISTFAASGIDSVIFTLFAFYRTMPNKMLITMILTMWLVKVVIEFIGAPISISLAKKLKRSEKLDIYDWQTNYNLFRLDNSYSQQDNAYRASEKIP